METKGDGTRRKAEAEERSKGVSKRQDVQEGGPTIQQRQQQETQRQRKTRTSGRQAHHSTKGNKKAYSGRRKATGIREGGSTIKKGKEERKQWKARDSGRWMRHPARMVIRSTRDKGKQLPRQSKPANTKPDVARKHHQSLTATCSRQYVRTMPTRMQGSTIKHL